MFYFYLQDNADTEDKCHFLALYDKISDLLEYKDDIIFNSSVPRLKQSKYRGIQAFKQLLKRINFGQPVKYSETLKIVWLKCFKMVWSYGATTMKINNEFVICLNDEITEDKLKQLTTIDNGFILSKDEPTYKHIGDESDIVDIMVDYIKATQLTKDQIIKVMITLLS